ncbi:MAG: glucose-6-phosphate isomerase [Clostridia bacterium]|nr:glucose-6-phosphate isomerase [Clostridia bacterium]
MQGISLDFVGLKPFIQDYELKLMESSVFAAHDMLERKTGAGRNMLGWMELPSRISEEEINKIKACASKINKQADVFIVVGIGGSYLGSKAVIDLFTDTFNNLQKESERKHPQILFAGNNLSGKYLRNLIEYIQDKEVAINVISKSGTTIEPAVAFRILKLFLEEKYGVAGAAERIYVTTDSSKGVLKKISDANDYETFVIPDDVGGRYSVLTPVGLLPMAVAGIDFEDILDGAMFAAHVYNQRNIEHNECYKYAAYRNILQKKGKEIEILASYEPSFQYFIEWFKQLFGESEGKNLKGIFPAGVNFTTDLHSMGQFIQDGKRNIFETVINIKLNKSFIKLPKIACDEDGLNYLADKEIDYINKQAFLGTLQAHVSGEVPNIVINLDELNTYNIGQLIMFFEKACAISGYISGVNPFDQPGVEAYKKNMMDLLKMNDSINNL